MTGQPAYTDADVRMSSRETVEWFMRERGCISLFRAFLAGGRVRYGQAFFNALPEEDRNRLVGTLYDTFHKDSPFDCYLAIENVLTK